MSAVVVGISSNKIPIVKSEQGVMVLPAKLGVRRKEAPPGFSRAVA